MKLKDISTRLEIIQRYADARDHEAAHDAEDDLRNDFIEYVAKECPNPTIALRAREVLKSNAIKFERWCA